MRLLLRNRMFGLRRVLLVRMSVCLQSIPLSRNAEMLACSFKRASGGFKGKGCGGGRPTY